MTVGTSIFRYAMVQVCAPACMVQTSKRQCTLDMTLGAAAGGGGATGSRTIVFDASKDEVATPGNGYKTLSRKLRSEWKVVMCKEAISDASLESASLLVLGGPRRQFTMPEFTAMQAFLQKGGSILYCSASEKQCNFNYFAEEVGISVNTDAVVRSVYESGYFHPKDVMIADGVLNRELNRVAGKPVPGSNNRRGADENEDPNSKATSSLRFVYPRGSSLNVQRPSSAVLSTGFMAYPLNRPIAAFHEAEAAEAGVPTHDHDDSDPASKPGRLVVFGSAHVFTDEWIGREENALLFDIVLRWLTHDPEIALDQHDAEFPDCHDYHYVPATKALAERLRAGLQEPTEVPRDFGQLFDTTLFNFDPKLLPEVISMYARLGMEHTPLALIPPQFDVPLPACEPAVFAPIMPDVPAPPLELFDLDEAFASERVRLAHLTNKCSGPDDVSYYIKEAGEMLRATSTLPAEKRDAKHVLHHIFAQLVNYKRLNQEKQSDHPPVAAASASAGAR